MYQENPDLQLVYKKCRYQEHPEGKINYQKTISNKEAPGREKKDLTRMRISLNK